jgi:glycosyltransferase involved in cell wall biosynthesis
LHSFRFIWSGLNGHYRSICPSQTLQKNHSNDFEIDIRLNVPVLEEDLGKFDIVHFHRRINDPEKTIEWIEKFQKAGAIVVCDVDDYWVPFEGHPIRELVILQGVHLHIVEAIKHSDYISTTTEIFASHIRKYNPNVKILINAIDLELKQWHDNTQPSDRVRVGWIGGSSHEKDLNRLNGTFNLLLNDKEVKDRIQVVMCGFDSRGSVTEINPFTKEEKTRPIKDSESIWHKFEAIFSDNLKATSDQYIRRNTLPITRYGEHYNHVDVCLAPLVQHTFNECKSELKIVETGLRRKVLIASDLYIYKELLTHGKNALLVDPKKDHRDWYTYIKRVILDEELRKDLALGLYNLTYPKYTIQEATKIRAEFYKEIVYKSHIKK